MSFSSSPTREGMRQPLGRVMRPPGHGRGRQPLGREARVARRSCKSLGRGARPPMREAWATREGGAGRWEAVQVIEEGRAATGEEARRLLGGDTWAAACRPPWRGRQEGRVGDSSCEQPGKKQRRKREGCSSDFIPFAHNEKSFCQIGYQNGSGSNKTAVCGVEAKKMASL
jgi:hypothetical protein